MTTDYGITSRGYMGTPPISPDYSVKWDKDERIYHWRVVIHDLTGGLTGTTPSLFPVTHDQYVFRPGNAFGLDTRVSRQLTLLPDHQEASPEITLGDAQPGFHHVNIFGSLIFGIGKLTFSAGTDGSLFKETSATDPTPVPINYNPITNITGLYPLVIGGVTSPVRLAICRAGGAIQIISDTSGTVAGTMHANTNPGWGIIQTTQPHSSGSGFYVLIYANGNIYTLSTASAITDAPTVATPSVPNGGYALGLRALRGLAPRAYWFLPNQDNTAGALLQGSEARGKIFSTNLEGTDLQELYFPSFPTGFYSAIFWNGGIVATDFYNVVWHDGSQETNLHLFEKRYPDSDKEYTCRGFWDINGVLKASIVWRQATGGTGTSWWWAEEYNPQRNTWMLCDAGNTQSPDTTATEVLPGGQGLPFSFQTRNAYAIGHKSTSGRWRYSFQPIPGTDAFTIYRKTSGAQTNTGIVFEDSGTILTPSFIIPGLEGMPKILKRVICAGDIAAGGTDCSVTIEVGDDVVSKAHASIKFTGNDTLYKLVAELATNVEPFNTLQARIAIAQGADTRKTPQLLPLIFEGIALPSISRIASSTRMLGLK